MLFKFSRQRQSVINHVGCPARAKHVNVHDNNKVPVVVDGEEVLVSSTVVVINCVVVVNGAAKYKPYFKHAYHCY